MKVLIACEFSGIVRDAFLKQGHDAVSCDLLPSEQLGPHILGDVRPYLKKKWDLVIAHPPCTYLCNSGVRWLWEKTDPDNPYHKQVNNDRWNSMEDACDFFIECLNANADKLAVENPVMHGYALNIIGKKFNFSIQPYQFGHPETKRTCFWTKNLPALTPTKLVNTKEPKVHYASPGPDRWKNRSRTLKGIAEAMASQWGKL